MQFHANQGTGGKTFTLEKGTKLGEYMKQLSPKRDGYIFKGWWTVKASGGTKIVDTDVVTGNAIYYAHWILPKYTVQFHANGGTGGKTFTLEKGTKLGEYMKQLSPKWEGRIFKGWWTKKAGGDRITDTDVVTGNTIYYAHWTLPKYTVQFHANQGTGGKTFTL